VTYSKHLRKALLLVLLSVSDYKHLDTSLYFAIINLHTELKPQVNASHEMNSLALTMLYAHSLVTQAPPKKIFLPPGKMYWTYLKILDMVWNICPPLRKLFATLESQAGYVLVYTIMSVERGWVEGGLGKNWHFPIKFLAKRLFS